MNIVEGKVRATTITAKDVVIRSRRLGCSIDVVDIHGSDDDAVAWVTSWASVEIVLLNVDPIGRNVLQKDVLVRDATNSQPEIRDVHA